MSDREPRTERIPVERLTSLLAVLAAFSTVPAMIGWILRAPRLVQPLLVFAPGRPWTLLVILLAATGVWALGARRPDFARRAALLTILATVIGIAANIAGWVLPLSAWAQSRVSPLTTVPPIGGIALSSGALFISIAVCTWMSTRVMPSVRRVVSIAIGAAMVMTVAGVMWVVQASAVLEPTSAGELIHTSVPSLVAALLLSAALLRRVAAAERFALAPPRWSPAVAGMTIALIVLAVWRSLESRETAQLTARAQIASDALQRAIDRQFIVIQSAVRRLAMFTATAGPGTEQFGGTTERLAAETDGMERLLLMDPQGEPRRAAPNDGVLDVTPQLESQVQRLLAPLQTRDGPPGLLEHTGAVFGLDDSRWGIAVAQPVRSREDGLTAVVALLDERGLFEPFLSDTSSGFIARAFVRDSQFVGPPRSELAPALTSTMHYGAREIRLTLTPLASALPSSLPDLVLVLGLAIAALVALTLWLARKTYEQASSVGMTRMQRAIDRATDGVWELDVSSVRMHRSDALLRYLGLEPSVINGPWAAWTARVHADDIAVIDAALQEHLAGRTDAFECEYRVRAGDDTWHTILDRGRVIERAADGRPKRLLGISADTTERARADAAREESERRFRAMFDTAYQLQLLLDLDGRVLEANRAAAELAGLTVDDLQGQEFAGLPWWPQDAQTRVQERVARASRGDSSRFEVELTGVASRRAIVDFSLKPILDQYGQAVQVLAEGRDLTERKRTEASLREIGALTTMGQLAARVAHDINNPLAGIQNAFLLVRGAIPADHPHFRFVGAIEREIARIAAVTRQLYETYRPDQAMGSSSSVILAVSDAVIFLDQVNRARGVRVVTDVARAPSLVPVPDALLRQTLYNLVQNAFDATPAGGTITVTVLVDASWCVIQVTDEGPGIPDALRERIFDPFFSTKDRSVKTGGMGIGLSLVRQSVLAVGGEILVHNREQGGTMFDVRFPMTPIDTGVLR